MSPRYGDRDVSDDAAMVVNYLEDIESAIDRLTAQAKRIADALTDERSAAYPLGEFSVPAPKPPDSRSE